MSEIAQKIASMIDMLPATEQALAFELIKRLVLAWDVDHAKLTPSEALALDAAEKEECISMDAIKW